MYETISDTLNNVSSNDANEIRLTQSNYSAMRILSNVHESETIDSFLSKTCTEICSHGLAIFHPLLELTFYNDPKQFINTFINNKNIQSLVRNALFRNIHRGNLHSFVLDSVSCGGTVKKFIKWSIDMKFIKYILSIGCDPKQSDNVATKYGRFFIDLVIRCASNIEPSELFKKYNNNDLIIDSFMNINYTS